VNEAFIHIVQHPFDEVNLESPHLKILERFTVVLYDKASILDSVTEARKEFFAKTKKEVKDSRRISHQQL